MHRGGILGSQWCQITAKLHEALIRRFFFLRKWEAIVIPEWSGTVRFCFPVSYCRSSEDIFEEAEACSRDTR